MSVPFWADPSISGPGDGLPEGRQPSNKRKAEDDHSTASPKRARASCGEGINTTGLSSEGNQVPPVASASPTPSIDLPDDSDVEFDDVDLDAVQKELEEQLDEDEATQSAKTNHVKPPAPQIGSRDNPIDLDDDDEDEVQEAAAPVQPAPQQRQLSPRSAAPLDILQRFNRKGGNYAWMDVGREQLREAQRQRRRELNRQAATKRRKEIESRAAKKTQKAARKAAA